MLPESLEYLNITGYEHSTKKYILPKSLICFSFHYCRNEVINKDFFSDSITHLRFGYCFDQLIEKD